MEADRIVEKARAFVANRIDESEPSKWSMAEWITKHAAIVEAAVAYERAASECEAASAAIGTAHDDVSRPFAANRERAITSQELLEAVRAARGKA